MQIDLSKSSISIFNINDIEASKGAKRKEALNSFVGCIRQIGFAGIRAEGLKELVNQAYEVAKRYFSLPIERKRLDKILPQSGATTAYNGFIEKGIENISQLGQEGQASVIESREAFLFVGQTRGCSQTNVGFDPVLATFHDQMGNLANRILNLIQEYFDVEEDAKSQFDNHSACSITRLTWYHPSKENQSLPVWCPGHFDNSPFALMPKATTLGLQMLIKGKWIDVIVPDDVVIFNTGRLFRAITAGLICPTYHRVLATEETVLTGRISLIHFPSWQPNFYIDPWKKCISEAAKDLTEEEKNRFITEMTKGKVDELFRIYGLLTGHVKLPDEEIRQLAAAHPNDPALRDKYSWAFERK